jgi:hypothetical protein
MEIEYFYVVMKGIDGSLSTSDELPEGAVPQRKGTTADIYADSKQIVEEIDKTDLAMRVAQVVVEQLKPAATDVPSRLKEALKERGIDPTSVTPSE